MIRDVEAHREFVGPWWLAIAVLEMQSREVVEPALHELQSVELGPMKRTGAEGRMALRWGTPASMTGELRITEVDANCTELTLHSYRHLAQKTLERVTERLTRRIEAAVAREIGTVQAGSTMKFVRRSRVER